MTSLTRREVCLAAGAASLTAALPASAQTPEVRALMRAARIEQAGAYVYAQIRGEHAALGTALARAETEQAEALVEQLLALGAPRPPAVRTRADADAVVAASGAPRDDEGWLRYGAACEHAAIQAHTAIAAIVQDAFLLQRSASMLAAAGAHLVAVRRALDVQQLPRAFETGGDTL